jgi:hypothetical protein
MEGSKWQAAAKEIVNSQDRDIDLRNERHDVSWKSTPSLNDDRSTIACNHVRVGHDVRPAHDESAAFNTTCVVLNPKDRISVIGQH